MYTRGYRGDAKLVECYERASYGTFKVALEIHQHTHAQPWRANSNYSCF